MADAVQRAPSLFNAAGLDLPPIPNDLAGQFKQRDDWCFSSSSSTSWPRVRQWPRSISTSYASA
jgi:hypothetical protein